MDVLKFTNTLERVQEELFYVNDTLQFEKITYYPDGTIEKIETFEDGLKNGDSYAYNPDGSINEESYFN